MPNQKPLRRFPVVISVMLSTVMIAVEATIVSTAMPEIVAQLGGLQHYSWVFSAYLLAQTAATVIFGKIADLYGRRPAMYVGISIFLAGSLLCGAARSMPIMIACRLVQGAGAGAIQPVGLTIIGDLYPGTERGKVQGFLASVWAISAVLGPILGGLIVRHLPWAWIFWVNVPIGVFAALGFGAFLHERKVEQRPTIDIAGAALSTCAIASAMVCLTEASTSQQQTALMALVLFFACSVLFVRHERRVKDPMISFDLWKRRPVLASNLICMLGTMTLMGLTSFLPMFMQSVLHCSTGVAGLALTMMLVGWPGGATIATRSIRRIGVKRLMFTGSICLPLGASFFVFLGPASSPVIAAIGSLIMGSGMGTISVSSVMLIQEIVGASERGSATASNVFSRNMGSTLGAAIFGAVFNAALVHGSTSGALVSEKLRQRSEGGKTTLSLDVATELMLQQALHLTFVAMMVFSLLVVIVVAWMPSIQLGRKRYDTRATLSD